MIKPEVTSFFHEDSNTVGHLVHAPGDRRCAIIDAALDYDQAAGRTRTDFADGIVAHVREHGLSVEWILETHAHADHLSAAPYLKQQLGGKIGIGEHITDVQKLFKTLFNVENTFNTDGSQFDRLFKEGDRFAIGPLEAHVLHTPGHTPACITYVIGDAAFVGDTLFMPDGGTARADFPGGDAATLYRSIEKILALPPETRLFICHDYGPGGRAIAWETTVAEAAGEEHPRPPGRERARVRQDAHRARQDACRADPADALDPGQHARRRTAAARGQRRLLHQDPDQQALSAPQYQKPSMRPRGCCATAVRAPGHGIVSSKAGAAGAAAWSCRRRAMRCAGRRMRAQQRRLGQAIARHQDLLPHAALEALELGERGGEPHRIAGQPGRVQVGLVLARPRERQLQERRQLRREHQQRDHEPGETGRRRPATTVSPGSGGPGRPWSSGG